MIQEYFSVQLSNSIHLGLPLADMSTVAQFEQKDICLVPGVDFFWYGVVNFKGSLLWVLDSDCFFDLPASQESFRLNSKLTSIVLTHELAGIKRRVALVVEKLEGIVTVELERLSSLPTSLPPVLTDMCTSSLEQENGRVCILDTAKFLQTLNHKSTTISV